MRNIKVLARALFIIFLAVTAYGKTDAVWQQILTLVAATALVLFTINDLQRSITRGD